MAIRKRFARMLAACAGLACAQAGAQEFKPEVWVNPGLFSYHLERDRGYRERNWGLGAEYVFRRDHALMAGRVLNSENQRTSYLGYQWRPFHWAPGGAHVHAGLAVALLDGYPAMNNGGWFVAPLPTLGIEYGRVGANLVFLPNVKHGAAVALQLKLRVW